MPKAGNVLRLIKINDIYRVELWEKYIPRSIYRAEKKKDALRNFADKELALKKLKKSAEFLIINLS